MVTIQLNSIVTTATCKGYRGVAIQEANRCISESPQLNPI